VRKPVFNEESVLRFAASEPHQAEDAAVEPAETPTDRKSAKKSGTDRLGLTLMLKPEVIGSLKAEAARKEKTVDQVVEKLVTKHLGKH
jgi:hypothetical protein